MLESGVVLGFDYGQRRIGVAVGQLITVSASAVQVISHKDKVDWETVDSLLKEWKPRALVVGLPLSADGEATPTSVLAHKFGQALHQRSQLPVIFVNEYLSSHGAQQRFVALRQSGAVKRKSIRNLDAAAAQEIVQTWLLDRHSAIEILGQL